MITLIINFLKYFLLFFFYWIFYIIKIYWIILRIFLILNCFIIYFLFFVSISYRSYLSYKLFFLIFLFIIKTNDCMIKFFIYLIILDEWQWWSCFLNVYNFNFRTIISIIGDVYFTIKNLIKKFLALILFLINIIIYNWLLFVLCLWLSILLIIINLLYWIIYSYKKFAVV